MIHDVRTETRWFTTKSHSTWHVLAPGDHAVCRSNIRPCGETFSDAQRDAYSLPVPRCLPCTRKLPPSLAAIRDDEIRCGNIAQKDAHVQAYLANRVPDARTFALNMTGSYPAPLTDRAAELGRDAGIAAASWVFDGNTTDAAYRHVLAGIEDIDPLVMDAYREPSLSGEFADDYSESDLARDLGIEPYSELPGECADAWADAASESFWTEIERIAYEHAYPSRSYVCPCCGDSVMDDGRVCKDCRKADCSPNDAGEYSDCQRPCPSCGDPRTADVYFCVVYERSDGETDYADGYLCEDHVPAESDVPGTLISSGAIVLEYEVNPLPHNCR